MRKIVVLAVAVALAACRDKSAPNEPGEPNESIAQATPVEASSVTRGVIGTPSDHDFYSFAVPAGGGILRAMTFDDSGTGCGGGLSTVVDLYAASGTPIATAGPGIGGCSDLWRVLPEGRYAVDVHGAPSSFPAVYRLALAVVAPPAPPTLQAVVPGSIASTAEFECTAIENGTGPDVTVWLETYVGGVGACTSATAGQDDTVLRVLDPAGPVEMSDDDSGLLACSQLYYSLPAGATRYACVAAKAGQVVPSYQLVVDTDTEPNDAIAQATPIAATSTTVAWLASDTDHDYYSFTVPAGGGVFRAMTFDGTGTACDVGLSTTIDLYGAGGNAIATGGAGLAGCSDLIAYLPAGSYAVDVHGAPSAYQTPYTLVTSLKAPPATPSSDGLVAETLEGTIDFDCFAIDGGTGAAVWLETYVGGAGSCTSATGNDDTVLRVLDTAGAVVAWDDDAGVAACSQVNTSIPAGATRFACVSAKAGQVVPSYLLSIDSDPEPSDSIAQATSVAATSTTAGWLGSGTDHDFFSFTVPAGGGILRAMTFDGTGTACSPAVTVDLYDAAGNALATSGPGLAGCSDLWRVLPEGSYAVDVHGTPSAYPAPYTLALALVPPPASPTLHAVVTGSIDTTTEFECSAIANDTGAPVTVWLETYVGAGACTSATAGQDDTVLRILDPAGPVAATDDDGGLLACSQLYYPLPAGATRYACVAAKAGQVVPSYQLVIDTDTEPNDSIAQAKRIDGTSTTVAWLASSSDHDYYAFTVPAGGGIVRAMTFDGTGTSCDPGLSTTIDLYGSGGNAIATGGAGLAGCSDLIAYLPEGSYALDVHGSPSAYQTPYTLVTLLKPPPATPSPDGVAADTLDGTLDFDCYALQGGTGGAAVWLETWVGGAGSCTSATGNDDTTLRVLDTAGAVVASDDDGGVLACSQVTASVPAGATRYACVAAKAGQTVPSYQLFIDADPEPSDSIAQATPVAPASTTAGWLGSAADHDYFSFSVPAGGGILRAMTFDGTGTACAAGLSTAVDLYDAAGNAIATGGPGLGGCSDLWRVLPEGSYAVDVHGTSSAYPAPFTLVLATAPPPGSPTLHAVVAGSIGSTSEFECSAVANDTGAPVTVWLETFVGGARACTSATAGQDDTVLRVLDPAGPVAASDDDAGLLACSQLYHPLPVGATRYACVAAKPGQIVPSYQLVVDTESEPNETIAQATAIAATSSTRAWLASDTDHDHYAFTVPAGGAVFRAMTFDGTGTSCDAALSTTVDLYGPAGNAIATAGPGTGLAACSDLIAYLPEGSYAVDVHGSPSAYQTAYTLVASAEVPAAVSSDGLVSGTLAGTADFDCFAIQGGAAGVTAWLETYVGGAGSCTSATAGQDDTVLRVLDGAGAVVASDDDGGVLACSLLVQPVAAGATRYACVTAKAGQAVPAYEVLIDTDTAPNDTIAQATTVAATSTTTALLGSATDHDYYSFTVPAGGGILRAMTFDGTATACNLGLATTLDLYASTGTLIATGGSGTGLAGCSELLAFLPAGSYAVDVHGAASSYPTRYALVLSLQAAPTASIVGTVAAGAIDPTTDFDCFAIVNGAAATETVRLATFVGGVGSCTSATAGQNDTLLRVLDGTGAVVASDDDGGVSPCSQRYLDVPAGETRWACVTAKPGAIVPSYELLASAAAEPNDSIAQAAPIDASSQTRSFLATAADHDSYSFAVPAGGRIFRAMTFDEKGSGCSPTLFATIDLYSSAGALIARSDIGDGGLGGACHDLVAYLPEGTYVVDVNDPYGQSIFPAPYALVTSLAAVPAPPYSADALLAGGIASVRELDCWTITNGTAATALVRLETFVGGVGSCSAAGLQDDTLLRVLDGAGAVDAWDDDGGINHCSLLYYQLPAGATRYACVSALDPYVIPGYELQIDFP